MKHVANWGLNIAALRGASYADVRIVAQRGRALTTKNGKVGSASDSESVGMSVRVIADGAWGFAASAELGRGAVEATAARAVEIARASARVKREDVRLAPEKPAVTEWSTPYQIDPFTTSVEQNIGLLLKIDAELRSAPGITLAEANLNFNRDEQWFVSSEGADIHQTKLSTGAGYAAYAFAGNEIQKRSYPNSFGGQWQNKGYELVEELKLVENARRIAEEAVALHKADQCPEGTFDLILDSSQLGLQIHESVGHPIELDRVLGMEANFAGTSFLTLDKLRKLRYGSELVNVVADARQEHGPGLGTFGFDDEGVAAQCTPIITNGLFTGYLSSRVLELEESAAARAGRVLYRSGDAGRTQRSGRAGREGAQDLSRVRREQRHTRKLCPVRSRVRVPYRGRTGSVSARRRCAERSGRVRPVRFSRRRDAARQENAQNWAHR